MLHIIVLFVKLNALDSPSHASFTPSVGPIASLYHPTKTGITIFIKLIVIIIAFEAVTINGWFVRTEHRLSSLCVPVSKSVFNCMYTHVPDKPSLSSVY